MRCCSDLWMRSNGPLLVLGRSSSCESLQEEDFLSRAMKVLKKREAFYSHPMTRSLKFESEW